MDSSYLFNLLGKFRQVRDLLLDKGPAALDRLAEVTDALSSIIRQASGYLTQVGPLVQFAPGGGMSVDLPQEAQQHLAELKAIHDELAAEHDRLEPLAEEHTADLQRQADANVQQGIFSWVSKIDPETRKKFVGIAISLLSKILAGSAVTGLLAPKATKKHAKKG